LQATSALDSESEALVQDALNKAARETTTLIVAHRLSTVKNVDRIFAMKDGQVEETGTHDELMAMKGFYYNLVNSQVFADNVDEEIEELGHRRARASNSVSSVTSSNAARPKLMSRNSVVADSTVDTARQQKDDVSEKKRLEQELKEEGAEVKNLLHILKYAKPEWMLLLLGILTCIIGGGVFPVFSIFFSNMLEVFAEPDPETKRQRGHNWALMFLVLGGIQSVCMLTQSICFGASAERLTKRLRSALFRKM
jgi:ATP-binding cassette subfamily B (MDR/TAP) protein 1